MRRARELPRRVDELQYEIDRLREELVPEWPGDVPWRRNLLRPAPEVYGLDGAEPFPAGSTPSLGDFLHPRFLELSAVLATPHVYHRKLWEWVFILNIALERGMAARGRRAIGFGVGGAEPIAAALARYGMTVTATDAPDEIGTKWLEGGQYAATADDLRHEGILDDETFARNVHYERCDMNDIPGGLSGFDFAWSSSCLEHLGDQQKGLDFVVNTVECTLEIGGVACHTTELNVSSNEETIESGDTVIYRRRDLDHLLVRLRQAGHRVDAIRVPPPVYPPDWWVDTPPYLFDPHLKLEFGGYAITSIAIVVERGR